MICQLCSENKAGIYIEAESIFKKKKVGICKDCAHRYGIDSEQKSPDFKARIEKLFSDVEKKLSLTDEDAKKVCPLCSTSLFEIKNNSVLGCPNCYSFFKDEIKSLIQKNANVSLYSGSAPVNLKNQEDFLLNRMQIEQKLTESIQKEEYEKAAVYRDYLNDLDKNLLKKEND